MPFQDLIATWLHPTPTPLHNHEWSFVHLEILFIFTSLPVGDEQGRQWGRDHTVNNGFCEWDEFHGVKSYKGPYAFSGK